MERGVVEYPAKRLAHTEGAVSDAMRTMYSNEIVEAVVNLLCALQRLPQPLAVRTVGHQGTSRIARLK